MSLSENRTHVMKMNSSINYLADLAKHDDVCSILWKTNDSCKTCNYLQSQLSLNGICEVKCKIEQKIIDWAVLLANESIKQLIRPWVNLPRGVKKNRPVGIHLYSTLFFLNDIEMHHRTQNTSGYFSKPHFFKENCKLVF